MDARATEEPRLRAIALPARGGTIAALEFGPPARPLDVVFSHANGFNARTYRTLLQPLAGELKILAIDLRGHGRSGLPADPAAHRSWDVFAEDLTALLAALDVRDVVLAGHSMGGTSSLLAAARAPERVRALVLFEPVMLSPPVAEAQRRGEAPPVGLATAARRRRAVFQDRQAAFAAYHGRGAFKTWTDAQLADYVADGFKDRPDGRVELACAPEWEAANFTALDRDVWPLLRDPPSPIRLFHAPGSTSVALPPDADALPVRIETVPSATHFLPMERPDLVAAALRAAAA